MSNSNSSLAPVTSGSTLPAVVAAGDERAPTRFVEFFASNIRNQHTRRAYARTIGEFLEWCRRRGVSALDEVAPLHVAAWIERQTGRYSALTVKQQLAAIRHLFDWLVVGQVVPVNPASSVGGPQSGAVPARLYRRDPHRRRLQAAAVPHHRAQDQAAHPHSPPQANAYAMVRRRARAAGITAYLKLSQKRRHAGEGRRDGQPFQHAPPSSTTAAPTK